MGKSCTNGILMEYRTRGEEEEERADSDCSIVMQTVFQEEEGEASVGGEEAAGGDVQFMGRSNLWMQSSLTE
jgi:hypothetical protein